MKAMKWILLGLVVAVVAFLGLAHYKFNVLQDDIYMTGTAITEADMVGKWMKPVDGMPDMVEGFELRPGAAASSINMATLPYTSWKLDKGKLILSGTSIGNGSSSPVTDVYTIDSVGKHLLNLRDTSGQAITYDNRLNPGKSGQ